MAQSCPNSNLVRYDPITPGFSAFTRDTENPHCCPKPKLPVEFPLVSEELEPRDYVDSAALVRGFGALLISGFLKANWEAWKQWTASARNSTTMSPDLLSTELALEKAASTYMSRTSDIGNDDRKQPEVDASSSTMEWMTPREAEHWTGVGERRIRQLLASGALEGRKTSGGRWLVSAESVRRRGDV